MDASELQRSQDHPAGSEGPCFQDSRPGRDTDQLWRVPGEQPATGSGLICLRVVAEELKKAGGDPAGQEQIDGPKAIELSRNITSPFTRPIPISWHDLTLAEYEQLREVVSKKAFWNQESSSFRRRSRILLETLLVLHKVRSGKIIVEDPLPFLLCLGIAEENGTLKKHLASRLKRSQMKNVNKNINENIDETNEKNIDKNIGENKEKNLEKIALEDSALPAVNRLSGLVVRARAPTRIGARMGRPEKSDKRLMRPPPHVLFPAGEEGGKSRSIQEAAKHSTNNSTGIINVEIERRVCKDCKKSGLRLPLRMRGLHGKEESLPQMHIPASDNAPNAELRRLPPPRCR